MKMKMKMKIRMLLVIKCYLFILALVFIQGCSSLKKERISYYTTEDILLERYYEAEDHHNYIKVFTDYKVKEKYRLIEELVVCQRKSLSKLPKKKEALEALDKLKGDLVLTVTLRDSDGRIGTDEKGQIRFGYEKDRYCVFASFFKKPKIIK